MALLAVLYLSDTRGQGDGHLVSTGAREFVSLPVSRLANQRRIVVKQQQQQVLPTCRSTVTVLSVFCRSEKILHQCYDSYMGV